MLSSGVHLFCESIGGGRGYGGGRAHEHDAGETANAVYEMTGTASAGQGEVQTIIPCGSGGGCVCVHRGTILS